MICHVTTPSSCSAKTLAQGYVHARLGEQAQARLSLFSKVTFINWQERSWLSLWHLYTRHDECIRLIFYEQGCSERLSDSSKVTQLALWNGPHQQLFSLEEGEQIPQMLSPLSHPPLLGGATSEKFFKGRNFGAWR